MSQIHHLTFPVPEEEIRKLRVGDIVYLTGLIHTVRDMAHPRVLDALRKGEALPFNLGDSAIWHCAPIVYQDEGGKWHVTSAGSTTSSRFTEMGSQIVKLSGMRVTLGKGTMKQPAIDIFQETGSVFLNTTGGIAALYARQIEEVEDAYWLELGLPETVWALRVKDFGPLIVGIDSHGGSLYENMKLTMNKNLKEQCEKSGISLSHDFSYLPVAVTGHTREEVG